MQPKVVKRVGINPSSPTRVYNLCTDGNVWYGITPEKNCGKLEEFLAATKEGVWKFAPDEGK